MNIKNVSRDYIEFENGHKYYHEDYVVEMNRRNYEKGLEDGRKIVIHKAVIEDRRNDVDINYDLHEGRGEDNELL